MSDIEKARKLFGDAGLSFPMIPDRFAGGLREHGRWLFSTRELKMSPYNLQYYVDESEGPAEYVIIGQSGHGVNSYAIQYYHVSGPLRLFLHLGWGGVYMDAGTAASKVRECFSLADNIVYEVTNGWLHDINHLLIVASDFYGSYWAVSGENHQPENLYPNDPAQVLSEALHWLKEPPPDKAIQ